MKGIAVVFVLLMLIATATSCVVAASPSSGPVGPVNDTSTAETSSAFSDSVQMFGRAKATAVPAGELVSQFRSASDVVPLGGGGGGDDTPPLVPGDWAVTQNTDGMLRVRSGPNGSDTGIRLIDDQCIHIEEGPTYAGGLWWYRHDHGGWSAYAANGYVMMVRSDRPPLNPGDWAITQNTDGMMKVRTAPNGSDTGLRLVDEQFLHIEEGPILAGGAWWYRHNRGGWSAYAANGYVMMTYGVDTTPPVITIQGANPVQVQVGLAYSDQGATAIDNRDGGITSRIVTENLVDTSHTGEYTVTYRVSDLSGNAASPASYRPRSRRCCTCHQLRDYRARYGGRR